MYQKKWLRQKSVVEPKKKKSVNCEKIYRLKWWKIRYFTEKIGGFLDKFCENANFPLISFHFLDVSTNYAYLHKFIPKFAQQARSQLALKSDVQRHNNGEYKKS